jgi:HEAT repeat protein
MSYIRKNFNLLEWAIYLAEREKVFHRRAEQASQPGWEEDKPGLESMLKRLKSANPEARRDIAKALGEIGDPAAAGSLVALLLDEDHSVRWTAMSSLINLQREAVRPLLEALTQDFQSARLREGAHHVLRALSNHGSLNEVELEVFHALEGAAPGIQAAWAANNALIAGQ